MPCSSYMKDPDKDEAESKSLRTINAGEGVKGNPLTWLVAMQTCITTMENSVEIP